MESFLHCCNRWFSVHKLGFKYVLFDSGHNLFGERFIPAHALNILNLSIDPDSHVEVDRARLSGQPW